jgi:CTP synthase
MVLDKLMLTLALEIWKMWKAVIPQVYTEMADIVLVGKYVELHNAYLSVVELLEHPAMRYNCKPNPI